MKIYELIAPCHFGLEAVLKREITDLGYEISKVEDGKVTFLGDAEAICYANIFLRTAERILLKVGTVHAETFDELFEGVRALPWEEYIPENGKFWVTKATSVKSKLFSTSDIQSIVKKAMVERLKGVYGLQWTKDSFSAELRGLLRDDCEIVLHVEAPVSTVRMQVDGVERQAAFRYDPRRSELIVSYRQTADKMQVALRLC